MARKCFNGLYGVSEAQYGNTKRHPCKVCCAVVTVFAELIRGFAAQPLVYPKRFKINRLTPVPCSRGNNVTCTWTAASTGC